MFPELETFFRQYIDFPQDELDFITGRFRMKKINKNEFLFRQGEICKQFIVVKSGCLRLFYFNGDTEVSVWFAFTNSSAIEISSFISQSPSEYNMQAIEESEIMYISVGELNRLCDEFPGMQILMKKYWEDVVVTLINRFTSLQRYSAEKRYLDLLKTPTYMQKIPQKHLASYIGVTPTSLSRIRKKIK
jgi:CRP/FNR family transcriptional regulator, anaerobic regulatory protein